MINKKSLMQMGGVPTEQNVDPAMEQIVGFISSSINEGQDPSEVIMGLLQQEVDQQIIGQALIQVGYQEEDVIALFDKIQKESQPAPAPTPQEQTQNPQELARNQAMEEQAETQKQEAMVAEQDAMAQQLQAKSGIEIKPENEGKFTKWATARNMSVQEAANKVMSNRGRYPASVIKMANFAKNAAGWKKQAGGTVIKKLSRDPSMYRTISPERQREMDSIGITDGLDPSMYKTITPERQFEIDYINYTEKNGPISVQGYSKLTGMDASMYRTITPERQLEDDIIKKEGGEFEPHFMYKGDRKIRAKDMATHLRLKERGYTHDVPKAQDGAEVISKSGYDYKKVVDPKTNTLSYYTKRKGAQNWMDLQDPTKERALKAVRADVFGDNIDEWEGTPEKATWKKQEAQRYTEKQMADLDLENLNLERELSGKNSRQKMDYGNLGIKVVQYPMGYKNMPPGHIEAGLYDKTTGKLVESVDGKLGYVNRWPDGRGHPLDPSGFDGEDVRVVDLEVDKAGITEFLNGAQEYRGGKTDYSNINLSDPGDAYVMDKRIPTSNYTSSNSGAYDFITSNCANGVCKGLGIDPKGLQTSAGITDPLKVMDYILKDSKFNNVRKNSKGRRVDQVEGLQRIIKDATGGYNLGSNAAGMIKSAVEDYAQEDVKKLSTEAFEMMGELDEKNYLGAAVDAAQLYNSIPSNTIPKLAAGAVLEGVDYIEDNTDLQFDMEGLKNIPSYWADKIGFQNGGPIQKRDKFTYSPNYANPNAFEMGDAFNPLKAANTLATGVSKLFGGKDRDGDGNKDGVFRDSRRKKAERKLNKGNYYDYDIEVDKNDPNSYAGDKLDLYNASKLINKDELRTTDQYNKDVEENSRVNYNTETGKYDKFISSRGPEEYEYRNAFDFVTGKDKRTLLDNETYKNASKGERLSYFTDADEGTRQEILDFGEAKKNGMPEGTTLSIDPVTGETSYMSPEADNPNEYDTMMGYNTYGKGNLNQPATTPSMIPTGTNGQPLAAMNNTPPRVPQLSFKEWTMQSPMNRMGANAQQQYQDYLAGKQTTPANSYGKASTPNLFNQEGKSKDAIEFFENKFPPIEDVYKYGGDLPKAQAGTSTGSGMGGMWFDQLDLENQMNTDFGLDTQAVANSQLQQQNPALGNTPLQNQQAIYGSGPGSGMGSMFLDQQAFQKQLNALNQNAVPAQTNVPTQPGYNDPKIKRTNKFEGGLNRFMDSKPVQAFAGVSEFAVNAADSVSDWFRSRDKISAKRDNRNQFGLADNIYGTNEDPYNKRGMWNTNKNEAGSEGDRTTGLYMSQKGGEVQVDNDMLAALIAAGADIEML